MSLDVYLELDEPLVPPAMEPRIYVRRDGRTVEISREEWDELNPGREPVTLAPSYEISSTVYSANITHNMGRMARECGLYEPLWRPEEIGITHARQLIEPLRSGLFVLANDREHYEQFNPENGWGSYDGLLEFTRDYLAACEQFPHAKVRVWR